MEPTPYAPKRLAAIALGILFTFGLVFLALRQWDSSGLGRLLTLALIQLAPLVLAITRKKMDYMPIVLGSHFLGYTLVPLLWALKGTLDAHFGPADFEALNVLLVADFLLLYVFHGIRIFLYKDPYRAEEFRKIPLTQGMFWALTLALLFSFLLELVFSVTYPAFFVNLQFVLTALAFCVTLKGASLPLRVLQGGLILSVGYTFLIEANLGFSINLIAIWLVQASLQRRLRPFLKIGLLLIPMLALQSVKSDFRVYTKNVPRSAVVERVTILYKIFQYKYLSQNEWKSGYRVAELTSSDAPRAAPVRTSGALARVYDSSLNLVIAGTPEPVPFWNGTSYLFIVRELIPNWLWPGDPIPNLYNQYGHVYGILSPGDDVTEVVFSYFAEAYMNFGFWAVYLIAILLGAGFAFLEKLSDFDLKGHYSFIFIIFLMPILSYQTALGALIQKIVFTAVVVLPFRTALYDYLHQQGLKLKAKVQGKT